MGICDCGQPLLFSASVVEHDGAFVFGSDFEILARLQVQLFGDFDGKDDLPFLIELWPFIRIRTSGLWVFKHLLVGVFKSLIRSSRRWLASFFCGCLLGPR